MPYFREFSADRAARSAADFAFGALRQKSDESLKNCSSSVRPPRHGIDRFNIPATLNASCTVGTFTDLVAVVGLLSESSDRAVGAEIRDAPVSVDGHGQVELGEHGA